MAFGTSLVAVSKPLFFSYFTDSEELVILLSLSRQEIHASHEESFKPDLDKTKCPASGFLHIFWTLRTAANAEKEVCFRVGCNEFLSPL